MKLTTKQAEAVKRLKRFKELSSSNESFDDIYPENALGYGELYDRHLLSEAFLGLVADEDLDEI